MEVPLLSDKRQEGTAPTGTVLCCVVPVDAAVCLTGTDKVPEMCGLDKRTRSRSGCAGCILVCTSYKRLVCW